MDYILQKDYPLKRGGKLHQPGDTVSMPADEAKPLLEKGRLKKKPAAKKTTAKKTTAKKTTAKKPATGTGTDSSTKSSDDG